MSVKKQLLAYQAMKDDLELDYFGKWVIIYEEKLVGAHDKEDDACIDAVKRYGDSPFAIVQVGSDEVVNSPIL